jgi:Peptidase A4 family
MARRWYIPLLALPVAIGTVVAVLEGVASASPGLAHTAARTAAVQRIFPGAPMISPSGGSVPGLRNGTVNPTAQSTNWSGYAVTSIRAGAFRTVSASWTEPRANCSGVSGRRLSSFWVGLDGANNGTVEQLGTDVDCRAGIPAYFAWWETFPDPAVNLPRRVNPGDRMFASVTFRGAGNFALFIRDSTRRWSRTIIRNVPSATRTSAEVIAEAPALLIGRRIVIQNLTNFGAVHWTGSKVNGILLKNIGRRIRITMVEVNPPHLPRAFTSLVSATDAFTNRWIRSS